jgi:hypothetical protein
MEKLCGEESPDCSRCPDEKEHCDVWIERQIEAQDFRDDEKKYAPHTQKY